MKLDINTLKTKTKNLTNTAKFYACSVDKHTDEGRKTRILLFIVTILINLVIFFISVKYCPILLLGLFLLSGDGLLILLTAYMRFLSEEDDE